MSRTEEALRYTASVVLARVDRAMCRLFKWRRATQSGAIAGAQT